MICTIAEFESMWRERSEDARKIFSALTDESLRQSAGPGERTLGRMAWHIIGTIPEMTERTGLKITALASDAPMPASAVAMRAAYDAAAGAVLKEVKAQWNDATLRQTDDMYGEPWTRGKTLTALILHQVHHLGQMTVLMRLAGLKVPGVFGPAREEWASFGMPAPEI